MGRWDTDIKDKVMMIENYLIVIGKTMDRIQVETKPSAVNYSMMVWSHDKVYNNNNKCDPTDPVHQMCIYRKLQPKPIHKRARSSLRPSLRDYTVKALPRNKKHKKNRNINVCK